MVRTGYRPGDEAQRDRLFARRALTPPRSGTTLGPVGSPITIGALSATAPPGETKSARARTAPDGCAGHDDRAVIEAVRAGNLHAFGLLYERHVAAVRCLARRLCGNSADADDVVAEVFTNTLRAIKSGRGPRDEMRSYVLTSTRHTVIKLRTRRDSGRAIPTPTEQLDTAVTDETFASGDGGVDSIGAAFVHLPDRFRNVLWLSCVEGMPPAEVGRRTELSAGAASSLTLRARRALARSYLVSRISQPIVSADCVPIRDLLPSVIRDEATAGTIARVDRHLATCCECRQAFDEMESLADSLRSFPWLAAALAWLRSVALRTAPEGLGGLGGAAGLAPVVLTAIAVVTFTSGDAAPPAVHVTAHPVAEAVPSTALAGRGTVTPSRPSTSTPAASAGLASTDPAVLSGTRSMTALREAGVSSTPAAGAVDVVADVVSTPPRVDAVLDPLDDAVALAIAPLEQVGHEIGSTADTLVVSAQQLVDDVGDDAGGLLEDVGTGQVVAPLVAPIVDTTTELVIDDVVEPVAEPIVGPVVDRAGGVLVDTTAVVDARADGLLAVIAQH
jgi:RNA polymerase sigma factor (sigma-70 family)